ncbi:hypothetical protein BT63DRAFT_164804 [Microthyrium microscopicum]|uniref:Uncharacterized protein n=1 Tax=Microthyrium microscopicum TaxID=703497 RepID=A0A6A6URM2_9PEZI|nr:hypothetical protein BT63DRAFT_164804 [Microthyrium microscopicum]
MMIAQAKLYSTIRTSCCTYGSTIPGFQGCQRYYRTYSDCDRCQSEGCLGDLDQVQYYNLLLKSYYSLHILLRKYGGVRVDARISTRWSKTLSRHS